MADDSASKTDPVVQLRSLMKEATEASETARHQLERAGKELSELHLVLERLGQVSAAFQPIADRLSQMTLDTARRVWGAGRAGEPFLALVSQLSELAGNTGVAVGDLDSYLRRATDALHAAVNDARQSSDELRRILPALHAANSTPPPLPQEKVIALELKITPTEDRNPRRPPSILDVWPERRSRDEQEN